MNEEELKIFKEKLETEFNYKLSRGEDVSEFLYFPHNFLSENIKKYLDEYLLLEAYKQIEKGNLSKTSFVVYKDSSVTVELDKIDQQRDLLTRLLKYFTNKEEYEKCSKVHTLLKQLE